MGRAAHRAAVVVAAILTVSLAALGIDVPPTAASSRQPADALPAAPPGQLWTPCSPSSNDAAGLSSALRCIGEVVTRTRGRVRANCIISPKALVPLAEYTATECRSGAIQAEVIAQARAIAQLNAAGVHGDSAPGAGITANLQWEVLVPSGGRADLLLYDRADPSGDIGLVEMKVNNTGTTAAENEAVGQVLGYVQSLSASVAHRRVAQHTFTEPFSDTFVIKLERCRYAPDRHRTRTYHTHSVPGADGILVSDMTEQGCPTQEEAAQEREEEPEEPYEGLIGVDADGNGIDDFLDHLNLRLERDNRAERIGPAFEPLDDPVRVRIGGEAMDHVTAVLLIGLAGGIVEGGGTAALWSALAPRLATQAVLVGAGSAGAVSLSLVVVTAAVAAAVVVTIWAVSRWDVWGDPHLVTLDGLSYDLQTVGEFHLLGIPDRGIDVQGRFVPIGDHVSRLDVVALDVDGASVELRDSGEVLVNSTALADDVQWVDLGPDAFLVREDGRVLVVVEGEDELVLAFEGDRLDALVPSGVGTTGLLGNNDGEPQNDLVTSDGEDVIDAGASVWHGRYADSWRVTNEVSSFTYGEEESTETFTDLAFPERIVTLGDFDEADLRVAADVCRQRQVVDGPAFDDCLLDVVATGDETYAEAASAVTDYIEEPAARSVDTSGWLAESFDGGIASNLAPLSLRQVADGSAAGPVFDGAGYSFSVPDLPPHSGVELSLDLLVFGIDGDDTGEVSIEVEHLPTTELSVAASEVAVSAGPATVEPLPSGTAPGGEAYAAYRVTVAGDHVGRQLRASVSPSGFRGVLGTSLAVDSLAVQLAVVPPEEFSLALGQPVADGTPAPGAGRVDDQAPMDEYAVEVPQDVSDLLVVAGPCSGEISWELRDAAGAVRGAGDCDDSEISDLDSGTYRLQVRRPQPDSEPTTYEMTVLARPADVTLTTVVGGDPVTVETVPAQDAVVSFEATAGERFAVRVSQASARVPWKLYDPDGRYVDGGWGDDVTRTIDPATTGTYTLRVDPRGGASASIVVDVLRVPADVAAGPAVVDGEPVTVVTTAPGQDATLSFDAAAGQRVQVHASQTQAADPVYWCVHGPDGRRIDCEYDDGSSNVFEATAAGTHTVRIDPHGDTIVSMQLQVWSVPADATAAAVVDGGPVTVATAASGQNGIVTFEGIAGQRIQAQASQTQAPDGVYWRVYGPGGNRLSGSVDGDGISDVVTLPETGAYEIVAEPRSPAPVSMQFEVWSVAPDVTVAAVVDGGPVTVATTTPGQQATVTFEGLAGQWVRVEASQTQASDDVAWMVQDPDGYYVVDGWGDGATNGVELATTGTYTIRVEPRGTTTVSMQLEVSTVPDDAAVAAVVDGGPVTVATTTPGQQATVTFEGTSGQRVEVEAFDTQVADGQYVLWSVYGPDGETRLALGMGDRVVDAFELPTTGTYTIEVEPSPATTVSMAFAVWSLPPDVIAGSLVVDGGPVAVATTEPRQQATMTFDGAAGQRVAVRGAQTEATDLVWVHLVDPDGRRLTSLLDDSVSTAVDLPVTGTYTVVVDPSGTSTVSMQVDVLTVPPDLSVTTAVDGGPVTVSTVPGQQATVSLEATAVQHVAVEASGTDIADPGLTAWWYVTGPDYYYGPYGESDQVLDLPDLPASGTYTIRVYALPAALSMSFEVRSVSAPAPAGTQGSALGVHPV